MNIYFLLFISVTTLLFSKHDCRRHGKNRLMRQRQQQQQPQPQQLFPAPNQIYANASPGQSYYVPSINPNPQNFGPVAPTFNGQQYQNSFPTNPPVSSPSTTSPQVQNYSPANVAQSSAYVVPLNISLSGYVVPAANFNNNPPGQRRRKKDAPKEKNPMSKLLEHGKNLLEISTMHDVSENGSKNEDETKTTLIPIPSGMQMKKFSKTGNHVVETMNITSSTHKTISLGNTTEIENIVEMQMQKEIENKKGDKQGSEEVRIVETERVKPLLNRRGNVVSFRKRKRKSYSRMTLETHHRSKRSSRSSYFESIPRSKTVLRKMARHIPLSRVRKERVVESNFLDRAGDTEVETNEILDKKPKRYREITTNKNRDEISMNKGGDVESFINFFIEEMRKYKKFTQDNNNKNLTKYSSPGRDHSNEISKYALQRALKRLDHPEQMIMNMNMHFVMNMPSVSKTPEFPNMCGKPDARVAREERSAISRAEIPVTRPPENATLLNDASRSFFFVVLPASFVLLLGFLLWNLRKAYRFRRAMPGSSKTYQLHYDDGKEHQEEGLTSANKEGARTEPYPQLEWQMETGDWLSDAESDGK